LRRFAFSSPTIFERAIEECPVVVPAFSTTSDTIVFEGVRG
jgi:hypothetical protein